MSLREYMGNQLIRWGLALVGESYSTFAADPDDPITEDEFDPDAAPAVSVQITPEAQAVVFAGEPYEAVPANEAPPTGGLAERIARSRARMEMGR